MGSREKIYSAKSKRLSALTNPIQKEGIKVKNDKVVEFEKLFWNPAEELGF